MPILYRPYALVYTAWNTNDKEKKNMSWLGALQ